MAWLRVGVEASSSYSLCSWGTRAVSHPHAEQRAEGTRLHPSEWLL